MSDFQYSFRAYDAIDFSSETQDLLDAKDKQLENYIKDNNTAISAQITANNANFFPNSQIRSGSVVFNLQAVGVQTNVVYATAFDATINTVVVVVTNGDYQANQASFAVDLNVATPRTRFYAIHTGGGAVGGGVRLNYIAIGLP